jgi:hypothetical protein
MDRRAKASRPARPTKGDEVLRKVDPHGSVSFAGTCYRVGNPYAGHTVGVRLVGDTVQITQDGTLLRTHRARHDKSKELSRSHAESHGGPRMSHSYRSHFETRVPRPHKGVRGPHQETLAREPTSL